MKLTIDTKEDSKDELVHAIKILEMAIGKQTEYNKASYNKPYSNKQNYNQTQYNSPRKIKNKDLLNMASQNLSNNKNNQNNQINTNKTLNFMNPFTLKTNNQTTSQTNILNSTNTQESIANNKEEHKTSSPTNSLFSIFEDTTKEKKDNELNQNMNMNDDYSDDETPNVKIIPY